MEFSQANQILSFLLPFVFWLGEWHHFMAGTWWIKSADQFGSGDLAVS